MRGELDWIVMKCLEKDRTRRYETASGLARDVERYLRDEPVEACPPSAGYRLRKFARKHRTALAVAAGFLSCWSADVLVSTWQAGRPGGRRRRRGRGRPGRRGRAPGPEGAGRGRGPAGRGRGGQAIAAAVAVRLGHATGRGGLGVGRYPPDARPAGGASARPDSPDLRGFEWHYLRGLGTTVHGATLAQDATFGQLSPDGTRYVYVGRLVPPQAPDAGAKIELKLVDVASGRPVMRQIVPFPGESMGNVDVRLSSAPTASVSPRDD